MTGASGAARWLFVLLLALYLITAGGHGYSVDGAFGYEMAKTAFLDPSHEYFHRFKTAFARWGALMPLLGQPLVLAGNALSYVAPERDALTAHGHTFRVEEWPAVGAGGRPSVAAPLPASSGAPAIALALISFSANSADLPQEAPVAVVRLWQGAQSIELPIRAGIETAEWAYDRPDQAGKVRHQRPEIAGHWIGQPRGNLYYTRLDLPSPMAVDRWELTSAPGAATGVAWHVRAAAFLTSDGGWQDAFTGERFWSTRETRDFFTRLIYATLNAFTTALAGTLVFLIARQFGYGTSAALVGASGFSLATMAWPYAKLDFSEPAATLFVLLAVWALYRTFPPASVLRPSSFVPARTQPALWLGGLTSLSLLLAVVGKYTSALAAGAVVVQWLLSSRWWRRGYWRQALAFGAALLLPALILGLAASVVAFRATGERPVVLASGTSRLREDWLALPFWTGFRGLIFSPGKSLFLYSPWLLLSLPGAVAFLRRHWLSSFLIIGLPLLTIVLYSMKLVWHGGSWGPRYMLPIVPFLSLAALPAVEWTLSRSRLWCTGLAALFLLSLGVQLVAIGKDPEQYPSMVREFVVPGLPEYGSRLGGRDYWEARGGSGLARALQDPAPASTVRGLGYLWGFPTAQATFQLNAARTFDLSLYFVDWDRQGRHQLVTVTDARGSRSLNLADDFGDGLWATWQVTTTAEAPLRIALQQTGSDTAVLSAAAFGPTRTQRQDTPVLDDRTKGTWRGIYGTDGYVLFGWRSFNLDAASLPPYVARYELTHVGDKPNPLIHVEIADQDLRDTPLLYAVPFSPLLGNLWLLAADAAHLVLPARPDLPPALLARPPWTWFGIGAPSLPHPEYGLGLDFWPTLLYTGYASYRGVIGAVWIVLLLVETVLVVAAVRILLLLRATSRATATLATLLVAVLAVYDWLQFQP